MDVFKNAKNVDLKEGDEVWVKGTIRGAKDETGDYVITLRGGATWEKEENMYVRDDGNA